MTNSVEIDQEGSIFLSTSNDPSDCKTETDIINYKKSLSHIISENHFNNLVDSYLSNEFNNAIRYGCSNLVELLISKYDQKIDNSDSYFNSLYEAFYYQPSSYNLIKLILDQGADINFPKNNQFSRPLIKAIQAGNYQITKLLLKYPELELNFKEYNYYISANPLYTAIINNNTAITKLLLQKDADPNINLSHVESSYFGASVTCFETLLGMSLKINNLDITKLLLQYKADPNIPSTDIEKSKPFYCSEFYNHFPLQKAVLDSNLGLAELLLEYGADPNISTLYPENDLGHFDLLQIAIAEDYLDMLELLLKYNSDPNGHSSSKSPIVEVVKKNNTAMIKLLLNYAITKPLNEESISLAVMEAVKLSSSEILNLLFSFYPNIEKANLNNKCAFLSAVNGGYIDIVSLLIKHNFLVDGDCHKMYALNSAIKNKNSPIVKLLINSGANVNSVDYANKTPLLLAVENSLEAEVEILLQKGANPNYMYSNAYRGSLWSPNLSDDISLCFHEYYDKFSILQNAVIKNEINIVKLLLEYSADVNLMTSYGWQPITTSVLFSLSCHEERQYNFDMAMLLLAYGADPNSKYNGIDLAQLALNTASHMKKVYQFMNECIIREKQNIESPLCLSVLEKSQKPYKEIARDNDVNKVYDFISALIDKGYTINRFNDINNLLYIYESSSLKLAVKQNDTKAVDLLSKVNISNKNIIYEAYKLALEDSNEEMIGLLSESFDINSYLLK